MSSVSTIPGPVLLRLCSERVYGKYRLPVSHVLGPQANTIEVKSCVFIIRRRIFASLRIMFKNSMPQSHYARNLR